MTTDEERIRAIEGMRMAALAMLDPRATPRVPRAVRERFRARLKHYPWPVDLASMARAILRGTSHAGGREPSRREPSRRRARW